MNGEGNPVEAKYRRLGRSHRTGRGDRELKPGPEMRDLLNVSDWRVGSSMDTECLSRC